jgi:hypothetical protein
MDVPFEVLIGIAVTGGLIVAILMSGDSKTELQHKAVREAAESLGLASMEKPSPDVLARVQARWQGTSVEVEYAAVAQGTLEATPVSVHVEARSDDDMVKPYLTCQASLTAPALSNLELAPQGLDEKIDKHFFDRPDLEVGDAELDEAFLIGCPDPDFATRLLTAPRVKQALLAARERVADFAVNDGRVFVDRDIFGLELEADAVSETLQTLAELAAVLDRASASTEVSHDGNVG